LFNRNAQFLDSGPATRVGDSHRFQFTPDQSGKSEQILIMALSELDNLTVFPAPVVLVGVHFRDRPASAVMCMQPNDRSLSLPASELMNVRVGPFTIATLARRVTGAIGHSLLEVQPA
jgi:hypothetical protein